MSLPAAPSPCPGSATDRRPAPRPPAGIPRTASRTRDTSAAALPEGSNSRAVAPEANERTKAARSPGDGPSTVQSAAPSASAADARPQRDSIRLQSSPPISGWAAIPAKAAGQTVHMVLSASAASAAVLAAVITIRTGRRPEAGAAGTQPSPVRRRIRPPKPTMAATMAPMPHFSRASSLASCRSNLAAC